MIGFVEVILLLLGLSNFGLQANPTPPTAEASLQYGMTDADVVVHVDAATFVPNNYKVLTQLANQPQIKSSPDLSRMVREVVAEVEGMRGIAKSTVGIDPTTDINSVTMFVQILPKQDPNFVAAVRGKFSPASLEKIAKLTNSQAEKVGGGVMVSLGGNQPSLGLTKDGVLLAGTPKLVRDRLSDTWKIPARPAGGSLAQAAEVIAGKPVFALAMSLSPTARKAILDELGPEKNFGSDLVSRHKVASFAIYPDGIGWTWIDRDRAGLDGMAQFSEGAIELLRASQIAPRGIAKMALAAIDSYRGTSKTIDELIRRKADIMKIVESYTGDGTFKVKTNKDMAKLRLDVRASGKTLSEVLPAGGLVPVAALALVGVRKKTVSQPLPPSSGPPVVPVRPMPKPAPAPRTGPAPGTAPAPGTRTAPAPAPAPTPKTAPAPAPRQ